LGWINGVSLFKDLLLFADHGHQQYDENNADEQKAFLVVLHHAKKYYGFKEVCKLSLGDRQCFNFRTNL
jgi:hypothetical protein